MAAKRARQNSEHGVQAVQSYGSPRQFDRDEVARLNWDDLKAFLHVTEEGSLRGGAKKMRVAVNTVRSKIARLEDRVGEALVARHHDGVSATPAGARLRRIALSMRGAAVSETAGSALQLRQPDELRIGASEGIGSGWLTPRLLDLQEQFPSLTMTMVCDNDLEVDRSDELDIQIVWNMPRNPELIVSRLATLHFMPFASREYVSKYGVPKTPEDLLNHRFIEQCGPGIKSGLLDQLVGTQRPPGFLPIRSNSSLAIFWAVANGAGIAFMPTYAMALVDKLVPIDLPFQLKFDLFYTFDARARSNEIIMAGVDWLKDCFDPELYPWFRPEFVHPNEFFPKASGNVVPLFDSLASQPVAFRAAQGHTA